MPPTQRGGDPSIRRLDRLTDVLTAHFIPHPHPFRLQPPMLTLSYMIFDAVDIHKKLNRIKIP